MSPGESFDCTCFSNAAYGQTMLRDWWLVMRLNTAKNGWPSFSRASLRQCASGLDSCHDSGDDAPRVAGVVVGLDVVRREVARLAQVGGEATGAGRQRENRSAFGASPCSPLYHPRDERRSARANKPAPRRKRCRSVTAVLGESGPDLVSSRSRPRSSLTWDSCPPR